MDTTILLISVGLFLLGACLGSFIGAQVWRLRARQLVEDKKSGEAVDKKELKRLKPLTTRKGRRDRSIDLDTGKQLPWYDMLPIVSWLILRGKSRFSGKPIGWMELLLEIGLAVFFVASFLLWPTGFDTWVAVVQFVLWLASGTLLALLFAYDSRWFILPNITVFSFIAVAAVSAALMIWQAPDGLAALGSLAGAVAILSGLYLILWVASKGEWVGFGDVKLGLGLALLLADWRLAFLALFAANLIGCLLVLPGLIKGTVQRTSKIPFGPLLITGTLLAAWLGDSVLAWLWLV